MPALAATSALLLLAATPPLSDAERELFLRTAEAVAAKPAGGGQTGTLRVTLRSGRVSADAHVQSINVRASVARDILHLESDFTDSYRYNIAAYLLDRLLRFNMLPVAVERSFRGKPASYTWWVQSARTEAQRYLSRTQPPDRPAFDLRMGRVRVFDFLIGNADRNKSNLLIDPQWNLWMIDHTRAFRTRPASPFPPLADACAPPTFHSVQALDPAAVRAALTPWLETQQIDALLERRRTLLDACAVHQAR